WQHNPMDYAVSVNVPCLILQGADDPRATIDQARRVKAGMPGSATLIEFPGLVHESLYGGNPELWVRSLADWLPAVDTGWYAMGSWTDAAARWLGSTRSAPIHRRCMNLTGDRCNASRLQ